MAIFWKSTTRICIGQTTDLITSDCPIDTTMMTDIHVATIVRITRGNLRLIDRLMLQVEHVVLANQLQVVSKEVVETTRQNLIIGPG